VRLSHVIKIILTYLLTYFIAWLNERELKQLSIVRFVTCVKEELLKKQLTRLNYAPKHNVLSRRHNESHR